MLTYIVDVPVGTIIQKHSVEACLREFPADNGLDMVPKAWVDRVDTCTNEELGLEPLVDGYDRWEIAWGPLCEVDPLALALIGDACIARILPDGWVRKVYFTPTSDDPDGGSSRQSLR